MLSKLGWTTLTLFSLLSLTNVAARSNPRRICEVERSVTTSVTTSYGIVTGYAGATATRYTVPYAQPPVGSLRFADPVPPIKTRLYDASNLPNMCVQTPDGVTTQGAEDCLYMNIFVPSNVTSSSSLPVFVWVHGGSFITGSITNSGLDGSSLANSQQMIVVTVQYRLGVLGFLSSSTLELTGNYGLKDIILALQYLQTNAAAFGGNPNKVTVAGQSSGAELIKTLLVTPSASSLFNYVILHSAPLAYPDLPPTLATAVASNVASSLSCTDLACLRAANLTSILGAQTSAFGTASSISPYISTEPIRPVVDGTLVTRSFGAVTSGKSPLGFAKNMIFTTVKDEGCDVVAEISSTPLPLEYFDYIVDEAQPARAPALLSSGLYDPTQVNGTDQVRDELLLLISDLAWTAAVQQSAVNLTVANQRLQKVYLAQFNMGISYENRTVPYCANKVAHQDDIYPLFGFEGHVPRTTLPTAAMGYELQARWGAFAHTGSPNLLNYPAMWQPVNSANLGLLVFGANSDGSSTIVPSQRPQEDTVGGLWGNIVPFDFQLVPSA